MRNPLSVALFTLMLSPLAAFAQQQFATPEQAATALAEAISQPNEAALSEGSSFYPRTGSTLPPSIAFNATGR